MQNFIPICWLFIFPPIKMRSRWRRFMSIIREKIITQSCGRLQAKMRERTARHEERLRLLLHLPSFLHLSRVDATLAYFSQTLARLSFRSFRGKRESAPVSFALSHASFPRSRHPVFPRVPARTRSPPPAPASRATFSVAAHAAPRNDVRAASRLLIRALPRSRGSASAPLVRKTAVISRAARVRL